MAAWWEGGRGGYHPTPPVQHPRPFRRSLQPPGEREEDPNEVLVAQWLDGYVIDLTNPQLAGYAPKGLQSIVAWEWKVAPGDVARWTYTDFYAALSVLTESRWTLVRAQQRNEDKKVEALIKATR